MEPGSTRSLVRRSGPLLLGALIGISGVGVVMLLASPARGDPILLAEPSDIRVHVAGEVLQPGVYELPIGSILLDAIDAAGGLSSEASQDRINLAAALEDGQQVYVPALSEPVPLNARSVGSSEPVAVNTASAPELERLPGIGPVLAQRIVEYREQNGPFQQLEDLLGVDGIGPSKLETLQDYVRVP